MGALRGYHGFNNWRKMVVEEESDYIDRTICFGFELEITQDYDVNGYWYWNNNKTPEKLADELESYFGDLFVYERDGSIGKGIEIISQPMSLKYYLVNQDKFKRLLEMCNEAKYVSTKGGKCGLHIHFSRSALGFNDIDFNKYKDSIGLEKAKKVDSVRVNKTIENMCLIMETYKDEIMKLSGRSMQSINRWCRFETSETDDLKSIKAVVKKKNKNGTSNNNRYKVVNTTNKNTVEIRVCRGTLLWESFNARILMMYHLVDIARNYTGLLSFKKLVEWNEDSNTINELRNYLENKEGQVEYRNIDIDNVKKKICLSLDSEFRISNENFIGNRF